MQNEGIKLDSYYKDEIYSQNNGNDLIFLPQSQPAK